MRRHLLVTNDFPPKIGGIQNYLWELWRRLPPDDVVVLTTPHPGAAEFDARQPFRVVRDRDRVLLPHRGLLRRIEGLADDTGAELVIVDPVLPLGHLAPRLSRPYGLVLHGAEITVPGRLPVTRRLMRRVLRGAELVVSAGRYAAAEAERAAGRSLPVTVVPPGVDVQRFQPLDRAAIRCARTRLGVPADAELVVGISRLVPRKGFDRLIQATAALAPSRPRLHTVLVGAGRDRRRLEAIARRHRAPVTFLGRVDDDDLATTFAIGDLVAMPCRTRWAGLEQEGFGIVFVEAAACGVPQIAGRSGGSSEAVADGSSGIVLDDPSDHVALASVIDVLLDDDARRSAMSEASRHRAETLFSYDVLAERLADALS